MKKVLFALILVLLSAPAFAAPASSLIAGKSSAETSLVRTIGDGMITVTCDFVTKEGKDVYVEYTVLSEEDIVIKVSEVGYLFDDKGGRVVPDTSSSVNVKIGGDFVRESVNVKIGGDFVREREIIAGVKTKIITRYLVAADYELAEKYARVTITINDELLTFRDIPSKKE